MAIGDKASAKGLVVYPATQSHSKGNENDNQRGDDIADEIDARTTADNDLRARTPVIKIQSTPLTTADAVGTLRFW
jgi:hypothetical protein